MYANFKDYEEGKRKWNFTHLVCNLKFLSLSNILALRNRRLESAQSPVIQRRGTRNRELNLAPTSTHQQTKLLSNTLQQTQAVVVGECGEEVFYGVTLVASGASVFLELGDNLRFVAGGEGGRHKDRSQLGVLGVDRFEGSHGLGDTIEGGGLDSCSVLLFY